MFFNSQDTERQKSYEEYLQIVGSLSNLFSAEQIPALNYRAVENIFCRAFEATNLSRGDIAVDAKKDHLGVGLKTFLEKNNRTLEKVAEFNASRDTYITLGQEELIREIARQRNRRIELAMDTESLSGAIYHCVLRDEKKFKIFEENMDLIDLPTIENIKRSRSGISFNDKFHEYNFNLSKSTLFKRFETHRFLYEFDVGILDDPLLELKSLLIKVPFKNSFSKIKDTIYLPLYGRNKVVFEGSGLNQWNAGGRKRHPNECYIPVPQEVHDLKPGFFPSKNTHFSLKLPDGKVLKAKLCQGGKQGKALMSSPNKDLGKWLLRDILKIKEGELVTYLDLERLDIDSVRIDKIDDLNFEMNFSKVNRYEDFMDKMKS